MIGGSETLQYVEYACMAVKHNDASQVTICCGGESYISCASYSYIDMDISSFDRCSRL